MRRLAVIVAGRRTKWFVLAAWIVLLFALAPLGSKLGDVTNDQTSSFLPKNAESTKVVNLLNKQSFFNEWSLVVGCNSPRRQR